MVLISALDAGGMFKLGGVASKLDLIPPPASITRSPSLDWTKEAEACRVAITESQVSNLADNLGVTASALKHIGVGWASSDALQRMRAGGSGWKGDYPAGAFTFPERNHVGEVIGLSLRAADGRKGAPRGAQRGLIIPENLHALPDPVLVVEGASDVAACLTLGLAAVGRPSNAGGAKHLVEAVRGRAVLVVGERDARKDGSWPGRKGAVAVAQSLQRSGNTEVSWTLPPEGAKDVRKWVQAQVPIRDSDDHLAAQGKIFLGLLRDASEPIADEVASKHEVSSSEKDSRTQADLLVDLARAQYRLGVTTTGDPFAVALGGPNVALTFRGARNAFRADLAREFRKAHRKTANSSALADALLALEGEAQQHEPEAVHLRVGQHGDSVILDLGDTTGRVVQVSRHGWKLLKKSPILFRRTALTGEIIAPDTHGETEDLLVLFDLLNIAELDRPLVLGWLLSALIPDIPHPILIIGGEQGTGKTTAARILTGLINPSPAPTQSQPRDAEQWAVSIAATWIAVIDNVSHIPSWWSDSLCKSSTGEGSVRRKLYTDDGVSVLAMKRVIVLTSIDTGALRGDLGDRVLLVDLERIPDQERRTEADLNGQVTSQNPRYLGALLSLFAKVMSIENVELEGLPRMADFAQVLAKMDRVLGTQALNHYLGQQGRLAETQIEDDPVGMAIRNFIRSTGSFHGTTQDLLRAIRPDYPPKDWPWTPRKLSAHIKRITPALRAVGIEVAPRDRKDKTRRWKLWSTAHTAQPPEPDPQQRQDPAHGGAVDQAVAMPVRPSITVPCATAAAPKGRSGDVGGQSQPTSEEPGGPTCDAKPETAPTKQDSAAHVPGLDPEDPGPGVGQGEH
tara:strand:- start:2170 stop:4725 length:2556 start_codon:yes stop_codon:yes gene_type:complete